MKRGKVGGVVTERNEQPKGKEKLPQYGGGWNITISLIIR